MLHKNNFSINNLSNPIKLTRYEARCLFMLCEEYIENEEEYKKALKEYYGITNKDDWFEYIYQQSISLQYAYNIEYQGWILDDLIRIVKILKRYNIEL